MLKNRGKKTNDEIMNDERGQRANVSFVNIYVRSQTMAEAYAMVSTGILGL